jgi:hypothetical protein
MNKAETLVYSGCSAGGLTAYIHTDYVAGRMHAVSPTTKVVGIADAMFSLEHNDVDGVALYQPRMQFLYETKITQKGITVTGMNASGSSNAACEAHYNSAEAGTGWKCLFGANVAPFVKAPMMVVNSKYDTWQVLVVVTR